MLAYSLHCPSPDSRTATPTPSEPDSVPAVHVTADPTTSQNNSDGQNFAKRIVAEILDRSVIKYRNSLVPEDKEEGEREGEGEGEGEGVKEGGGDADRQKKNYINYDIAQTVLVSSRDAWRGDHAEEEEEREGSRTPTGELDRFTDRHYMYMYYSYMCNV